MMYHIMSCDIRSSSTLLCYAGLYATLCFALLTVVHCNNYFAVLYWTFLHYAVIYYAVFCLTV